MLEKDNPNFDPEATDQNKYLTTCNPESYDSCMYKKMEKRMMAEVGCTVPYLPNVDDKICADKVRNDILVPKLFWPTVRKNWTSDQEKLLKSEAEGQEFAKFLRSLEQFIQTVKGQNNFW